MLSNFGIRRLSISPSSPRRQRRRVLPWETLEARYALSSMVLESDPCVTAAVEVTYDESTLLATPADSETATDGNLVGPLEADAYYESLDAAPAAKIEAEGEALSPPVIDRFDVDLANGFLLVTGHVSDDVIAIVGYVVRFGDLLEGHIAIPMPNGFFHYYTPMAPGTIGMVSAVATDNTGLLSQEVQDFV